MGEICEGYVRDEVRDEPLKTPLNKGFLLKNVRDYCKTSHAQIARLMKTPIFVDMLINAFGYKLLPVV